MLQRSHLHPQQQMHNAVRRVGTSTLRSAQWAVSLPHHRRLWTLQAHKALMVVESPAKAVKIQKFLGDQYEVLASYGHVRDLPSRNGSVDPNNNFAMQWELSSRAHPRMQAIETAARGCSKLLLATDPDREGEAIAWHVQQELQRRGALPSGPAAVERVTFTEVTKDAVTRAVAAPRAVSGPLVDAYLARRCLDYLFGFTLSPLLWRKLNGARSAGRVQSVALRLVSERETEIEAFNSQEYWSIAANFSQTTGAFPGAPAGAAGGSSPASICARLVQVDGDGLGKLAISSGEAAGALQTRLEAANAGGFVVARKSEKSSKRSPPPPFITSTLQQAASSRLGFSATRTMAVAQELYEGANTGEGLITYMRTDGVNLSKEATEALRSAAAATYGADHLPPSPRTYKSRSKNAQEAHEAIRPTSPTAITPGRLPASLTSDQRRLYELIWRRAVASQMADAQLMQVAVDVADSTGDLVLRANGSTVTFPGYLAASGGYSGSGSGSRGSSSSEAGEEDGVDDSSSNDGAAAAALLALEKGQGLGLLDVNAAQHFTKPPPRYNEGTLVKALEEKGIGRPSTYAPILKLLRDRGYVEMAGRALVATSLGRVLDAFLKSYFDKYVDYDFTSKMEEELDDVSGGRIPWRTVLSSFWGPFNAHVGQLSGVAVTDVFDKLQQALLPLLARPLPDGSDPLTCPSCGGRLALKPSRATGAFLGCTNYNATGCSYARPISIVVEGDYGAAGGQDGGARGQALVLMNERELGVETTTGQPVFVKQGPYGLYVQQGTGSKDEGAPPTRRMPLPKGATMASTTLQQALELLKPPRSLGLHPDDQSPITVQQGRFGPYAAHRTLNAPLPKGLTPETVSLEEALAAIERKVARAAKQGVDPYAVKPRKGKAGRGNTTAKRGTKAKGTAGSKATGGSSTRALSGYQLFYKEQRIELMAQQPKGANSISVVAAAWRALTEADKGQWQAKAREQAADSSAAAEGAAAAAAAAHGSSHSSAGAGKRDSKVTAATRTSRASSSNGSSNNGSQKQGGRAAASGNGTSSGGSSRPLSGYTLFVKENGQRLRQAAPPGSKAFAVAAEAWKALDVAEKAHWQDMARQQRQ